MKAIKYIPIIFCLALFASGCGGGDMSDLFSLSGDGNEESSLPEWTFLAYICGDTCDVIEGPSLVPVNEFMEVGSTEDVHVVVQRDMCEQQPSINTQRLYINKDEYEILEDLGELDMGDYETLIDFIEWGMENYPAQQYILYLYDHGNGWYFSNDWEEPGGAGRKADAMIWDNNNDPDASPSPMDIDQFRYALEQTGLHPAVIVFGPCYMGTVEVAYELRNVADIIVASEKGTSYFGGGAYADTLQAIVENPDITAPEVATVIVEKFIATMRNWGDGPLVTMTLTAIDLSKMEALASAIDDWGAALADDAASTRPNIEASLEFLSNRDLGHFASLQGGAEADAVLDALDDATVFFDYNGSSMDNATGLSIYLDTNTYYFPYYSYDRLQFYDAVPKWIEYIQELAE